jgi:hypothetical protein
MALHGRSIGSISTEGALDLGSLRDLARPELEQLLDQVTERLRKAAEWRERESEKRMARGGEPLKPGGAECLDMIRLKFYRGELDRRDREAREADLQTSADVAHAIAETEAA